MRPNKAIEEVQSGEIRRRRQFTYVVPEFDNSVKVGRQRGACFT